MSCYATFSLRMTAPPASKMVCGSIFFICYTNSQYYSETVISENYSIFSIIIVCRLIVQCRVIYHISRTTAGEKNVVLVFIQFEQYKSFSAEFFQWAFRDLVFFLIILVFFRLLLYFFYYYSMAPNGRHLIRVFISLFLYFFISLFLYLKKKMKKKNNIRYFDG